LGTPRSVQNSYNFIINLLLSSALQRCSNPDLQRVITLLEKAILIAPYNTDVHLNLAHIYEKQKEEEKAVIEFNKTIELSKETVTLVSAHLGLMAIYEKRGDFGKANAEYDVVRKIYPGVDDLVKQAEIYHITPVPQYPGEPGKDDELHPYIEKRIKRVQKEIKKLSEE
jgi:tetratricopeptide (TPR) repeat protein